MLHRTMLFLLAASLVVHFITWMRVKELQSEVLKEREPAVARKAEDPSTKEIAKPAIVPKERVAAPVQGRLVFRPPPEPQAAPAPPAPPLSTRPANLVNQAAPPQPKPAATTPSNFEMELEFGELEQAHKREIRFLKQIGMDLEGYREMKQHESEVNQYLRGLDQKFAAGDPKRLELRQRAVQAHVRWMNDYLGEENFSRLLEISDP